MLSEVSSCRTPRSQEVSNRQSALDLAHRRLEVLRLGLGDNYAISLPAVTFQSMASLKEFCGGLLNPGMVHPWTRPVSALPIRDRLSIAGSLFLFRKVLPATTPDLGAFFHKMVTPAPEPPSGFLRFCSQELNRMFPHGWDRGWERMVKSTSVTTSACLESSRSRGGGRALLMPGLKAWFSREEFCSTLLDKYTPYRPNVETVKVTIAACDGKDRLVTINGIDMTSLLPYHTLLYNRISKESWCLRGEAKTSRFSEFVTRPGEVLVSGDYESATDNLNQDVARHILSTIGRRCSRVPLAIREAALRTLSPIMFAAGKEPVHVRRGQLMGNAMSFPLLCLQNYLAFKFFVRRDVPVRINGDDIVFRSTPEEYERWSKGVSACGLTLSLGKTMVSKRMFSLNSTFFVASSTRVRLAPVVRSTAVFKSCDDLSTLSGRMETLRSLRADRRVYWEVWLLKSVSKAIWWSQRSLRRGLDVFVGDIPLKKAGLWDREVFYASLPVALDPPSPVASIGYYKSAIPKGWVRKVGKTDPAVLKEFLEEMIALSWNPVKGEEVVSKDTLRGPAAADLQGRYSLRRMRLAGFRSRKCFQRWIRSCDRMPPSTRRAERCWVRERVGCLDEPICFTRSGFA